MMSDSNSQRLVPVHALNAGAIQAVLWLPLGETGGGLNRSHYRVSLQRAGLRLRRPSFLLKPEELVAAIEMLRQARGYLSHVQTEGWPDACRFVPASDLLQAQVQP